MRGNLLWQARGGVIYLSVYNLVGCAAGPAAQNHRRSPYHHSKDASADESALLGEGSEFGEIPKFYRQLKTFVVPLFKGRSKFSRWKVWSFVQRRGMLPMRRRSTNSSRSAEDEDKLFLIVLFCEFKSPPEPWTAGCGMARRGCRGDETAWAEDDVDGMGRGLDGLVEDAHRTITWTWTAWAQDIDGMGRGCGRLGRIGHEWWRGRGRLGGEDIWKYCSPEMLLGKSKLWSRVSRVALGTIVLWTKTNTIVDIVLLKLLGHSRVDYRNNSILDSWCPPSLLDYFVIVAALHNFKLNQFLSTTNLGDERTTPIDPQTKYMSLIVDFPSRRMHDNNPPDAPTSAPTPEPNQQRRVSFSNVAQMKVVDDIATEDARADLYYTSREIQAIKRCNCRMIMAIRASGVTMAEFAQQNLSRTEVFMGLEAHLDVSVSNEMRMRRSRHIESVLEEQYRQLRRSGVINHADLARVSARESERARAKCPSSMPPPPPTGKLFLPSQQVVAKHGQNPFVQRNLCKSEVFMGGWDLKQGCPSGHVHASRTNATNATTQGSWCWERSILTLMIMGLGFHPLDYISLVF
ncbi:hypothetical protein THAOC_15073 [Thalassiosira oceanica]|uniref:Uncharacterized protein n=1 Tax=Thalassiosira oceanica TaxID=159749 RepID=K0T1D5_THAOC|nr:hypothetical protein THAOC_15073 [Thalassiosira oceanica]|eukprot:EJK64217.1 hypothetical protein THAOC_15073 [Thalassiosira oceanica]